MFFIYQLLLTVLLVISPFFILYRILKNKEHKKRFIEKFSITSKQRKSGNLIWFHGASVGEIQSIIPLVERFEKIQSNISSMNPKQTVKIIAVSKTFPLENITPLIDFGHIHYGENKVQEAISKWGNIKQKIQNLNLHMIGKLQSNKAKDAVKLFDYIHSLDNQKLADTLKKHEINLNKQIKYFIQVNIGNESQKSGIPVQEVDPFYNYCKNEKKLNI